MAQRAIAWEERDYSLDRQLRRWARAGVTVKTQSEILEISVRSIHARRSVLGISRKLARKGNKNA